jgi:translocation and assembly module TamA
VGFYDIGYVEADALPDGEGDYQAGAGAGLRYTTPIGPVRLDLATPVTGDDAYESVQVYIGIGQSF